MDAEQLKTHINAALEPLLQRITALETENQQIRAILKTLPQPKPTTKPGQPTTAPNTTSVKKIPPGTKPLDTDKKPAEKKETHKVEQQKQEHHENGQHVQGETKTTQAGQKKQPTKPGTATGPKRPPVTQPDPKHVTKTPQVDKKTPTVPTGGRTSVGTDKANPKGGKTKTQTAKQEQGQKHQGKQEQKKQENHENKQDHTKDKKTTKPADKNPHVNDKATHSKPSNTITHGGVKAKPTTAAHTNSKKQLPGVKKSEQNSQQKKQQSAQKVQPTQNTQKTQQKPVQQKVQAKPQQTQAPHVQSTEQPQTEQQPKSDQLAAEHKEQPIQAQQTA